MNSVRMSLIVTSILLCLTSGAWAHPLPDTTASDADPISVGGSEAPSESTGSGAAGDTPEHSRAEPPLHEAKVGDAEPTDDTIPIGFDFAPHVGTSSVAPEHRRVISFNLLGGLAGGLDVFELGAGINIHTGDVNGIQIAGGINVVDADVNGFQVAPVNLVSGAVQGMQLGVVNLAREEMEGLTYGVVNVTTGPVRGAQLGVANLAGGSVHGVQAGVVTVGRGGSGARFGVANILDGDLRGTQFGVANIVSGDIRGAQFGVLNIAGGDVSGPQIGVLNIAETSKAGVGLLNIYSRGYVNVEAFVADDGLVMAGIRHGSGWLYNVYVMGSRMMDDGRPGWASGLGIGTIIDIAPTLDVTVDLLGVNVIGFDWSLRKAQHLTKFRPMLTWQVAESFALFGGPTATLQAGRSEGEVFAPFGSWRLTEEDSRHHVHLWPGLTVGARFF